MPSGSIDCSSAIYRHQGRLICSPHLGSTPPEPEKASEWVSDIPAGDQDKSMCFGARGGKGQVRSGTPYHRGVKVWKLLGDSRV